MNGLLRVLAVFGLAGAVPGLVWLTVSPIAPASVAPPPSSPIAVTPVTTGPVGTTGCAAAACHGNPSPTSLTGTSDPDRCWQSSASHWLAVDPHQKAYAALTGELATKIMGHLRAANPALPGSAAEYDRCLACHTNPSLAGVNAFGLSPPRLAQLRAEGVGCEACHGNAGGWLIPHTSVSAAYPPAGMTDLNDIGIRANTCAGCHVGAPADEKSGYGVVRDMNHDMIAAGHPRLNFELAEFQRSLPPHWAEKERSLPGRPAREPAFEAKAWLVGRIASAEAACELLANRLDGTAWPEFAEFNCFACHHSLEPNGWRQTAMGYYTCRTAGALSWQTIWPVTSPAQFRDALPFPELAPAADAVRSLQSAFSRAKPPASESVRPLASGAAAKLAELRQAMSRPGITLPVDKVFEAAVSRIDALNWDEAGQLYLGLAATARSRERRGRAYDQRFDTLRDALSMIVAPDGTRYDSPKDYAPDRIRSTLAELIAAGTENAGPK